jgi:CRP-like cAMP-binding protein
MDEQILSKLVDAGSECEFDAGHVIIEAGQPGTGLYLIREGTVRVEAPERTVELGPGQVVGERALDTPHGVRSARVVCVTDVRALAVDRSAYEAAMSR